MVCGLGCRLRPRLEDNTLREQHRLPTRNEIAKDLNHFLFNKYFEASEGLIFLMTPWVVIATVTVQHIAPFQYKCNTSHRSIHLFYIGKETDRVMNFNISTHTSYLQCQIYAYPHLHISYIIHVQKCKNLYRSVPHTYQCRINSEATLRHMWEK